MQEDTLCTYAPYEAEQEFYLEMMVVLSKIVKMADAVTAETWVIRLVL